MTRRRTFALAACAAVLAPAAWLATPARAAVGTSYHVSTSAACSDAGSGTIAQPWCSFTPVNAHHFLPGDSILLAAGSSWDQELDLSSSGVSGLPITIASYGSGARPMIARDGHNGTGTLERAVYLSDVSNVTVDGIAVSNAEVGIEAFYDQTGLASQNLVIENVDTSQIHGIHEANMPTVYPPTPTCNGTDSNTFPGVYESSGVLVAGPSSLTVPDHAYVLSGLTVTNVTGSHNQDTFATEFCNGIGSIDGTGSNLIQDVRVSGLNAQLGDGGGVATGCPDGVRIVDASNVVVTGSTLSDQGACKTNHGTTALMLISTDSVTIENSDIGGTPNTGSPDQSGIDLEYENSNTTLSNDSIHDMAGNAIELQCFRAGAFVVDFETNIQILSNQLTNNGTAAILPYTGHILINGGAFTPTGAIENNTYTAADGLFSPDSGAPTGFTVSGNTGV